MMDWYSWLSKSGSLDPSLVREYSALFSRNELDADDIPDFDHDFLRSMGVSVAKHRLHILRLAHKHNNNNNNNNNNNINNKNKNIIIKNTKPKSNSVTTTPNYHYHHYYVNTDTGSSSRDSSPSRRNPAVSRLLAAISKTTTCLARYLRSWAPPRGADSSSAASALVELPRHESRGRRRTAAMLKRGRWAAACGGGGRTEARRSRQPVMMMITDGSAAARRFRDGCGPPFLVPASRGASPAVCGVGEEIRWDCMFQGLKPT